MATEIKKIFISYSWKPYTNKLKVIELAERLTNDGIHVILDDWDLKEGQDKYHFMEQMVNDESVNKVLLVCNKEYAEKANKKQGGVGIESLIVSDEIYQQVEQTKFIPVVMQYENEKPCLPTFIKTRIYIDLSDENVFEDNYDKLIRNIHNKPLSQRPPIGKMPIHLQDDNPKFLPTAHKVKQIENSLISGNKNNQILIKDYLQVFIDSLILFKLDIKKDNIDSSNFIEKVELSIEELQPLKNDFIEFLNVLCKYSTDNHEELFLDFFERLLQFYEDNEINLEVSRYLDGVIYDNYRFFNYDLFLSFTSILLKFEKYKTLGFIFKSTLIIHKVRYNKTDIANFIIFRKFNYTLSEYKNQQINPRRVSVVADFIKKYSTIIKFEENRVSDVLGYYMSLIYSNESLPYDDWYPETSCYNPWGFDLFPKIISKRHFEKFKHMFDVNNIDEYQSKISKFIDEDKSSRGPYNFPKIEVGLKINDVGKFS